MKEKTTASSPQNDRLEPRQAPNDLGGKSAGQLLCECFAETFEGGGWADAPLWADFDERQQARWDWTAALFAAPQLTQLQEALKQGGWQPIETAPKDGTGLILCIAGFQPTAGLWFDPPPSLPGVIREPRWLSVDPEGVFETDAELADYLDGGRYEPTHWQPLPNPPSVGEG